MKRKRVYIILLLSSIFSLVFGYTASVAYANDKTSSVAGITFTGDDIKANSQAAGTGKVNNHFLNLPKTGEREIRIYLLGVFIFIVVLYAMMKLNIKKTKREGNKS